MGICVRAIEQADGAFVLALDPSQTNLTACSYVVQSGAEIGNSPFNLSAEDGLQISYAIVALWAIAYAFKAIISTLKGSEDVHEDS